MTPDELSAAIHGVLVAAVNDGQLQLDPSAVPDEVRVERPRNQAHGDYATNVALQVAKPAGRAPREVAELLAAGLREVNGVAEVEVAGPGFLNVSLDAGAHGELARTIVLAGREYGRSTTLAGTRVNLEFVSANPTGPLHLGHTRWAAVGDALGRVLAAAGADVTREFYVNDAGAQMDKFGASLLAAAHGEPIPEDGYHGAYVPALAQQVVAEHPEVLEQDRETATVSFREHGYRLQLAEHRRVLESFGTTFDVWFSERDLHEQGRVAAAIETLREQGNVFDADGAVWLRTTEFGDDKDRVLVKADGDLTYFAADAAYYLDKRARGFDTCVYMLGADHHGYVGRLRAVAACAGDDPARTIDVLIGQLVNLVRDGKPVRLSKRAGNIITLEELVEWVGVDAARYSLARSSTDSALTLDVDVLTSQTNDNPVFYVQYAHARISSLLRNAADLGIQLDDPAAFDPALLTHEREGLLLGALGELPRVVATAAELREAHRVARYLEDLAGTYHRFYDACRVLPTGDEDPQPLHLTRLWLCNATRTVLANGLDLLGVSAPERM